MAFDPGTRVYDVNTKQTGTLKTAPYVSDSGARQVADVRWDNGTQATVFTDHIRAYSAPPARARYEALYAEYVADGTYCIGRDAWWPADLDKAHREARDEAEAAIRA